jgi:hypothetical protein
LSSRDLAKGFIDTEFPEEHRADAKRVLVVESIESAVGDSKSIAYRLGQMRAAEFRHYLILVRTDDPVEWAKHYLSKPYAYYDYPGDKSYYWIEQNDLISRKNFSLVAQFLTMQAVAPAQNAGPSPTLSVSGGR